MHNHITTSYLNSKEHKDLYGTNILYKPSLSNETEFKEIINGFLCSKFSEGQYKDSKKIKEILQSLFVFVETHFLEKLKKQLSQDLMSFVLHQYDISANIDSDFKTEKLNNKDELRWKSTGPIFRRTSKYVAESITLLSSGNITDSTSNFCSNDLGMLWLFAEEMVRIYHAIDKTFLLFPKQTSLNIYSIENPYYWKLETDAFPANDVQKSIRTDTSNRCKFIQSDTYLKNTKLHEQTIGKAFEESTGIPYTKAIEIIKNLITYSIPNESLVPFLNIQYVEELLAEDYGYSKESIRKIISGFSLKKENLTNRVIFKPKQEYRALKRGFFEFAHPTGKHLIFSKAMATEALTHLVRQIPFSKIPSEWETRKTLSDSLSDLSITRGKWFERQAIDSFKKIDIKGQCFENFIGQNREISIPKEVGEIDFLGYSTNDKALIIGEFKMVLEAWEARLYKDDIDKFMTNKKSYSKKFISKINWINENQKQIIQQLIKMKIIPTDEKVLSINPVMITLYPTIVSYLIDDFECVSITHFMLDFKKNNNKWPYTKGIKTL